MMLIIFVKPIILYAEIASGREILNCFLVNNFDIASVAIL